MCVRWSHNKLVWTLSIPKINRFSVVISSLYHIHNLGLLLWLRLQLQLLHFKRFNTRTKKLVIMPRCCSFSSSLPLNTILFLSFFCHQHLAVNKRFMLEIWLVRTYSEQRNWPLHVYTHRWPFGSDRIMWPEFGLMLCNTKLTKLNSFKKSKWPFAC